MLFVFLFWFALFTKLKDKYVGDEKVRNTNEAVTSVRITGDSTECRRC